MADWYQVNKDVSVDLNRVLSIAATADGIRLTYVNREEEVIAPIPVSQRNRLLDYWLQI